MKSSASLSKARRLHCKEQGSLFNDRSCKESSKQLDRMELIDRPETAIKPEFSFKESRASSRFVFEGENVEIGYTHPLLPKLSMTIERGEKIAIVGCNGVGKSTLLKQS